MITTPRQVAWCAAISLALLSAALFWALGFGGGLYPSRRAVSLASIALAAAMFALFCPRPSAPLNKHISRPFFVLCGLVCLQLVPLPLRFMEVLSPQRAAQMQAVTRVTGVGHWAPISAFPAMTWLEGTTVLGCVLAFLLVRQAAAELPYRWLAIAPLVVAGAAEAALGLIQAVRPTWPANASGTFLNRNHFAGFLELLFPFALVGAWAVFRNGRLRGPMRVGASVLLLLIGVMFLDAIFHTYSRMGSFVVAFLLVFGIALTLWPYAQGSLVRRITIASALVALSIAPVLLVPTRLVNRIEHASVEDHISTEFRLGFWRDSLPLLADYALTGCGLGAFESVYPRYQRTGTSYRVEYAHNDFLQAVAEVGVPAFVVGLWLLAALLRTMGRALSLEPDSQERLISIACISSVGGMLLHSVVDFNLHIPANAITFAWILGFGLSTRGVKEPQ